MNIADYKRILAPLQSNTLQLRMTFLKQVRPVHRSWAAGHALQGKPPSVHCCAVTNRQATLSCRPHVTQAGLTGKPGLYMLCIYLRCMHLLCTAPACILLML